MDAEKITMYRPLEDKSGAIKQFPATVSSQVFDEESGKTVVQQFDDVAQQLAHIIQVDVKMFKLPSETHWDSAISKAVNYATTLIDSESKSYPLLLFPHLSGGYRTLNKISIPHKINVQMESPIICESQTDDVLVIGGAASLSTSQRYVLKAERSPKNWDSESSVIKIYNTFQADISIVSAMGGKYGVTLIGDTTGFAYNSIYLQNLYDNQYHINLTRGTTGYNNENKFFGGRFGNTSFNKSYNRYGVLIDGGDGRANSNIFYSPSFEIGSFKDSNVESIPVLINSGRSNRLYDCRNESNGNVFGRITGESFDNTFTLGYSNGSPLLEDLTTSVYLGNHLSMSTSEEKTALVYDSGYLPKKSHAVSSSKYRIGNLTCASISSGNDINSLNYYMSWSTGNIIYDDYVEIPRTVGVVVTSNNCKEFKITAQFKNATFRTYVILYDKDGNLLDNKTGSWLQGSGATPTTYFKNSYYLTNIGNEGRTFRVHENVTKMVLLLGASSGETLQLQSFKIEQIATRTNQNNDVKETVYTPFDWMNDKIYVDGIPTTGKWKKGQELYEVNPVVGGYSKYVCLTDGDFATSPPTFGKVGLIETA